MTAAQLIADAETEVRQAENRYGAVAAYAPEAREQLERLENDVIAARDRLDQARADAHSIAQERQPVTTNAATEKQINFIATLASERDWDAIGQAIAARFQATMEAGIDKAKASEMIEWLKKQPRKGTPATRPVATTNEVPDGFYAVTMETHKNETSFFRLRTGKRGRWEGFQFADQVVGGASRGYPVRGSSKELLIAAILEQGVTESRERYGREIGRCGCCNRTLTDDTSRARGIGPECWSRLG